MQSHLNTQWQKFIELMDLFKQDASEKIYERYTYASPACHLGLLARALQWGAVDTFKMIAEFPEGHITATWYLMVLCMKLNKLYRLACDRTRGCYLVKTLEDPVNLKWDDPILKPTSTIFLYNNELYFFYDRAITPHAEEINRILKTEENGNDYDDLLSKLSHLTNACRLANDEELSLIIKLTDTKLKQVVLQPPSYKLSRDYLVSNIEKYHAIVAYLFSKGADPSLSKPANKDYHGLSSRLGFGYAWQTDSFVSIGEFCTRYLSQVDRPVRALMKQINGDTLAHQSENEKKVFCMLRLFAGETRHGLKLMREHSNNERSDQVRSPNS